MPYEITELQSILQKLISDWESEVVEFKQGRAGFSTHEIGKYLSALSNEANLRNRERAWLIFGVDDKTQSIVGTDYRQNRDHLLQLKHQMTEGASICFRDIHELQTENGRVLMMEIPPAPLGIPIAWQGHYYARAGESLVPLDLSKIDFIRSQSQQTDWSAQIVSEACLKHLDEEAVIAARRGFAFKHANHLTQENVNAWPLDVFLDRARITIEGQITRTALLLLGKAEAMHFLSPHPAQLVWKLVGQENAYEHFYPPFLLSTSALYRRIRNVQLRILPESELLAKEMAKYDQKVVLEALHNCIAHQDYTLSGRVIITEYPDRLVMENLGGFYEGFPNDYILNYHTPRRYRNTMLAQAMAELSMIDAMGYGIQQMFEVQRKRFFPLPDYDLSGAQPPSVKMTLHGQIIDPAYSRLLIQKTDLDLSMIIALDKVQKGLPVDDELLKLLRKQQLVEGRKGNLHIAASVAKKTSKQLDYMKVRSIEDSHYCKLITDYLNKFGKATRAELDVFLIEKLSESLSEQQKKDKVHNLLTRLRKEHIIENTGSRKYPRWSIVNSANLTIKQRI